MIDADPVRPSAAPGSRRVEGAKIGFVLLSNAAHPEPSTRIAALNLFPHLKRAGHEPLVAFDPPTGSHEPQLPDGLADSLVAAGFDAVVFQKVHGPSVEAQARRLRERGVPTLFSNCDRVVAPMAEATDATLAVTEHLRSLYPAALQARVHVVHDGIEREHLFKPDCRPGSGTVRHPLRAVLVTSVELTRLPAIDRLPRWLALTIVGRYAGPDQPMQRLREVRWALARQDLRDRLHYLGFLLQPRVRRVAWQPDGVYEHLIDADIGVIPIDPPEEPEADAPQPAWQLKSENRLTLKMAVGLPVVATPIPAYEAVIEQGVNGFLARSPRDWQACLAALRDPDLRREMGARARASVLPRFSQAEQARRFIEVLDGVLRSGAGKAMSGASRRG